MNTYYQSRYRSDPHRSVVWQEIVRWLKPYLAGCETVVDLGAGYCDFINNIPARHKYAVDITEEINKFAAAGVKAEIAPAWKLDFAATNSVDLAHASNLLEHFTDEEIGETLTEIMRVLKPGGKLILLQPNFRLSSKRYFDDYTHKKIFTDESLKGLLVSHGYKIIGVWPRFLPFSMRSKLAGFPGLRFLVRLYLALPFKPCAGQMLLIAEKKDQAE